MAASLEQSRSRSWQNRAATPRRKVWWSWYVGKLPTSFILLVLVGLLAVQQFWIQQNYNGTSVHGQIQEGGGFLLLASMPGRGSLNATAPPDRSNTVIEAGHIVLAKSHPPRNKLSDHRPAREFSSSRVPLAKNISVPDVSSLSTSDKFRVARIGSLKVQVTEPEGFEDLKTVWYVDAVRNNSLGPSENITLGERGFLAALEDFWKQWLAKGKGPDAWLTADVLGRPHDHSNLLEGTRVLKRWAHSKFCLPPLNIVGKYRTRTAGGGKHSTTEIFEGTCSHPLKELLLVQLNGPAFVPGELSGSKYCVGTPVRYHIRNHTVVGVVNAPYDCHHGDFKPLLSVHVHKVGRALSLSRISSHMVYHQFFEVVPRLALAAALLHSDPSLVIVNQGPASIIYLQALHLLNIPLSRVLEYNVASEAVLVTDTLYIANPHPTESLRPTPESLALLKELFLPPAAQRTVPRDAVVLLVRRPSGSRRSVLDHNLLYSELKYMLRSEFPDRWSESESGRPDGRVGVRLVTFLGRGKTVRQQAELFSSASVVISPHGAELSNLAFCRHNTSVLELVPDSNRFRAYYSTLAHLAMLDYSLSGIKNAGYSGSLTLGPHLRKLVTEWARSRVEYRVRDLELANHMPGR